MGIEQEIIKRIMIGSGFAIGSIFLKMFRMLLILYLVFSILPVVHGFDQSEQWKGSVKTEKGVTVLRNPQKPIFDENILEFEEELVIPESDGRIITASRYKLIENIKYFDVFSMEGKYLTTTSLSADFDGYDCVWKNDKLYTMGKDEDGLPEVKIYRIKWKDKRGMF